MWNLNKPQPVYSKALSQSRVLLTAFIAILLTTISAEANANNEGIRIHGDWIVTVSEPDGTVVQEWIFSNALLDRGKGKITQLLTGTHKMAFREDGSPAWDLVPEFDAAFDYQDESCTAEYSPNGTVPNSRNTSSINAVLTANPLDFTLMRSFSLPAECLLAPSYSITAVTSYNSIDIIDDTFGYSGTFSKKTINIPGILPDQVVTLKVTFSFQ